MLLCRRYKSLLYISAGLLFMSALHFRPKKVTKAQGQENEEVQINCTNVDKDAPESSNCLALGILRHYGDVLGSTKAQTKVHPMNLATVTQWWEALALIAWYFKRPHKLKCQHIMQHGDWRVCQDQPMKVTAPCLVYSFGINYDFSFDKGMEKLGCSVFSFDPSMTNGTYKPSNNITFYKIGLGGVNTDTFIPVRDMYVRDNQTWKMRTLDRVMEMLGHEKATIDVLKLDIETSEWPVLHSMLETGVLTQVRHFLLEYHLFDKRPAKADFLTLVQDLRRLDDMGFQIYKKTPHPFVIRHRNINLQCEVSYYNAKFTRKL